MAIFGYARVSSISQNLDRQLDQLMEYVPDERNIIIDKQSGKNFDRMGYNSLVGSEHNSPLLREGDLLIITSLDRLGRNYSEIHEQWRRITKEIKADIKILSKLLRVTAWILVISMPFTLTQMSCFNSSEISPRAVN